eukprot:TRINITY_DN108345_c0_g1_i1.p1 TRINITY_DN108345_c0_g1~~TRINITY_DN108345_c0_g1_i1.p1  ORF type:complete len:153 (+),score=26.76 TRINITY_DN108345_c0_g1_i1:127-585(+)
MAQFANESFEAATVRTRKTALDVLRAQLEVLRDSNGMNTSDISELLRDVCEELNEMASDLTHTWKRTHPGQPQPPLAVEVIPAEELEKIGWDSHSNRVRILAAETCVLSSLWSIIQGDHTGGYAKPPSAHQVLSALSAVEARLADADQAYVE